MDNLIDLAAERCVIACAVKSGDTYLDMDYLVQVDTFTDDINQVVWKCIKSIKTENLNAVIDLPLLRAKAKDLGLSHIIENVNEIGYIKKLLDFNVDPSNATKFAAKIRKLQIARLLVDQLNLAKDEVLNVDGSESIEKIFSLIENRIFDFSSLLMSGEECAISHISSGADEYFKYLCENPRDLIGISSGLKIWDSILGGFRRRSVSLIGARTGVGKCFGVGTPILKYDGSIARVEDIRIGDMLIGPDSKPRLVSGINSGYGHLYRVTPVKGDSYIVNEHHILSLKDTVSGKITNIGIMDYIDKSNKFKHMKKGWRSKVDWNTQELDIPPYILGLWIGDGTSRDCSLTSTDKEIFETYEKYSKDIGMDFHKVNNICYRISRKIGTKNPFLNELKKLNLLQNKHIPQKYLINSRENRLELLAGLIDTDGHLSNGCYEITTKYPRLSNDILFLARSLGFAAYKTVKYSKCQTGNGGWYCRIYISGDIANIPVRLQRKIASPRKQKKDVLRTGIKVEYIGVGEYYGFEVDKDHLFLLGDFTVVHNSMLSDNVALHVAGNPGRGGLNIPVLYMDTEMEKDGHWHRLWANISSVKIKEIENGYFSKNEMKFRNVKEAKDYVNSIPYYYINISGKPFEETLSYIRKWLIKEVGYDENGKIKDCLVIYDYLKMMTSSGISDSLKEFQVLGFQMTGLHNFAVKFDIPILSFVQLNRDGIEKESTDTVSQSDRIVWLASNLSIYKPKSDTEMSSSMAEGDRKLIVVKNRFGPVNAHNEYINMKFDGSVARITEGRLSSDVPKPKPESESESNEEGSGEQRKAKRVIKVSRRKD